MGERLLDQLPEPVRRIIRAAGWHRRLIAAALTAIAVASALSALAPGGPAVVSVLAAARDLPAGVTLTAGDLRTVRLPPRAVPDGALRPAGVPVGRMLAGPMRRGEALTDVRLVGGPLVDALGSSGLVAAPVRIADAGAVRLLTPGVTVDVLAATADGRPTTPTIVASAVRVIAVPSSRGSVDGFDDGALVVLATTPATATALAQAAARARLSVTILGGAG
jgi:Flp pilus assembly protein CpaB